ncbi:MAG: LuxR C-terminal-related transcriptional regulator [Candidatus Zixiibacteriota bacterium]
MPRRREPVFTIDRLILESFSNERSAYYLAGEEISPRLSRMRNRLIWHINSSLSKRQKQVIRLYLKGQTERQIAANLGVTQQVVHIYKHRAIRKLRDLLVG